MNYQVGDTVLGNGEPFTVKAVSEKYVILRGQYWPHRTPSGRTARPDQKVREAAAEDEIAVSRVKLDKHQRVWVAPRMKGERGFRRKPTWYLQGVENNND